MWENKGWWWDAEGGEREAEAEAEGRGVCQQHQIVRNQAQRPQTHLTLPQALNQPEITLASRSPTLIEVKTNKTHTPINQQPPNHKPTERKTPHPGTTTHVDHQLLRVPERGHFGIIGVGNQKVEEFTCFVEG